MYDWPKHSRSICPPSASCSSSPHVSMLKLARSTRDAVDAGQLSARLPSRRFPPFTATWLRESFGTDQESCSRGEASSTYSERTTTACSHCKRCLLRPPLTSMTEPFCASLVGCVGILSLPHHRLSDSTKSLQTENRCAASSVMSWIDLARQQERSVVCRKGEP